MSQAFPLSQGVRRSSPVRPSAGRGTLPCQPEPSVEPAALWAEHGFALSARWAVGLAVCAVPFFTLIGLLLQ